MKVKDALKTLDFLSDLNWWGVTGLLIIISLISCIFIINALEKIAGAEKDEPLKQNKSWANNKVWVITIILILLNLGVILLKVQADINDEYNLKANSIKTFMIDQNWVFAGYKRLAREVDYPGDEMVKCKDDKCIEKRAEDIKKVVKEFPDEFIPSSTVDSDKSDISGIRLVDEKAIVKIDSQISRLIPHFKQEILRYMKKVKKDTLTYDDIGDNVDNKCRTNALNQMIAKDKQARAAIIVKDEINYYAITFKK